MLYIKLKRELKHILVLYSTVYVKLVTKWQVSHCRADHKLFSVVINHFYSSYGYILFQGY